MIVKAVKTYKDKHTGGMVPAGALLDMEQERAEELINISGGPYVERFDWPVKSEEPKSGE